MLLLLLYVGFALSVSFLCSLLEATLLSARVSILAERDAAGRTGSGMLRFLKQNRLDDAISAILILNTISNTLGATMAGAQAARVFGNTRVGIFSGVLTFLILVFSEIIPKTLGATYAAKLSGFAGYSLTFLTRIMGPALILSRRLTRMLSRDSEDPYSRGEIGEILSTASEEGALSTKESEIFANILRFNEVHVEDVMTPRTVTFMMPAESTLDDLLSSTDADAYSRIPLYRKNRDDVVGYVLQRDLLKRIARGCDRSSRLETFMRPVWFIPEMISIDAALRQFLDRREPIAMVADEHGGIAGLVTLEDLTETVLGTEIVDESDRVVNLRRTAAEYRDRRLERLRRQREIDADTVFDEPHD